MKPIYTAVVIGAGAGGSLSMAALAASERFQLLGVADALPAARERAASRFPGIETFATYQELFARCPADVVCVSTYAPSHHEIALAALALPLKGIVVEKPVADTAAIGRAILDAVRARDVPIAVPHGLLVARHSREILDRVHAGEIGELRLVEIECDKWDIINAGIHWLNFFVALTRNAPVEYVMGMCDTTTRTYRDGMQVETLAVTYAQTASGVRVVMQTGDYVAIPDGKGALFRLVGTGGIIEFWGWESAYRITNARHPDGLLVPITPHAQSNHQLHLEALAEQIDSGQRDDRVVESALTALELCEGAYRSHQLRCAVTLPLERFAAPTAQDWAPGQPYSGSGGGRDGRALPAAR